jgi:hypothetical protein
MLKRHTWAVWGLAGILGALLALLVASSRPFTLAEGLAASVPTAAEMGPAAGHAAPRTLPATRWIPVPPPPMGWSSWNSFSNTVDSHVIEAQTKAMAANGMKKLGYQYINIDEGWWLGKRDQDGNIMVEARQWPPLAPGERKGDMSNIVRFIHRYGLKAGIYTDAGESGCSFYGPDIGPPMPHTGSLDHYDQDFLQFAKWGYDYVKVDWCGGYNNGKNSLDPAAQYTAIAHSIERAVKITGHQLFYSLCEWGVDNPWMWAAGIGGISGDIWRTSGDIVAPIVASATHSDRRVSYAKVFENFDQGIHPSGQHTGFYNDPDMMVIGMPGMSEMQNRVHMSLWAMSGAPLLVGADLTKLDHATLGILTNPDVIAIDQDSLGIQAIKVEEAAPGLQVWAKPMPSPGEHAVMLLNRTASAAEIKVGWAEIGLDSSAPATVRDIGLGKDLGSHAGNYASNVPAGDAVVLFIHGTDGKAERYEAASPSNDMRGGAAPQPCKACSSGKGVAIGAGQELTFKIAPAKRAAYVEINYLNRDHYPASIELSTSGQTPTDILLPPTGEEIGAVMVAVESTQRSAGNTLKFSRSRTSNPALVLDSIAVLPGAN